jgi:hypothetical protein
MSSYLLQQGGDKIILQDGTGFVLLQEDALPPVAPLSRRKSTVDVKWTALAALGYTGALPDRELQWLQANGATSDILPQAWSEMVASKGYGYPYSVQNGWYKVLQDQGYSGALPDMEWDFWDNGGTFS